MISAASVVQLILLVGGSGAVGALINGVLGRKKVKADASAVLSEASAHLIEGMREDLDDAKERLRAFQQALWEHEKWDRMVVKELAKAGVESIPDPPILFL